MLSVVFARLSEAFSSLRGRSLSRSGMSHQISFQSELPTTAPPFIILYIGIWELCAQRMGIFYAFYGVDSYKVVKLDNFCTERPIQALHNLSALRHVGLRTLSGGMAVKTSEISSMRREQKGIR